MKSDASNVADYIAEQPQEWQPTLRKLRAVCRRQLRGYTECMAYGMPSYQRAGEVHVSFARQAHYLSLYILQQPVLDAHRSRLATLSVGKGCIRYRRPEQVDWAIVSSLLAGTQASGDGAARVAGPRPE
jgi:uncharacterized protein YdhG (YjbR/CyaY superfamily)